MARKLAAIKKFIAGNRKKKLAEKVTTLARKVRHISPEVKYSDTFSTNQQLNYSPTTNYVVQPFSGISQGDADVNNRNGDTIFVKNIRILGTFYNADSNPMNVRIVVLKVKQNIENLLSNASAGNALMESAYATTVNMVEAMFDNDNRFGFTKLSDRRYILNPGASNGSTGAVYPQSMKYSLNLKCNFPVEFFQGSTNTTHNGVYILFLSDKAASLYQTMSYVIRTTYTDS